MLSQSLKQAVTRAAVTVAALVIVGCEKNQDLTAWWQGEQQRIELRHQLELKKYRFEQVYSMISTSWKTSGGRRQ